MSGPAGGWLAGLWRPGGASSLLATLSAALLATGCGQRAAEPAVAAPAVATAGASSAAASGPGAAAQAPGAAAASAPPVSVTLVRAVPRDFSITLDASGTVVAHSTVDIKPQVSAQVLQVHVKEGQAVQRGQPLFTLDARTEQANLKRAEAQLLKDQATLADATRQLDRALDLLARGFVSQGAVDTARANVDAQQAVLAADRAAIDAVKVQLSYSRISAPSAGRVGAMAVFPGSAVSPTGAALLTLTQIDPVGVSFSVPQRNLPDALKALNSGAGQVTATLPDGLGTRQGRLSFVDSAVDAASGTVKVKAQFDNKDRALWPGAYVTVKMALQTLPDAIVVPQAAIVQGARGTSVFAADKDNKAVPRPIKVLASAGADAVVSGLRPGERVVLDGRQNVRPGATLVERMAEGGPRGPRGAASSPGMGASGGGGSSGGGGEAGPGTAASGNATAGTAPGASRPASGGARTP